MCANSEGSGQIARMRRVAWGFAGRLRDKYHNLMSWLNWNPQTDIFLSFEGHLWQLLINARSKNATEALTLLAILEWTIKNFVYTIGTLRFQHLSFNYENKNAPIAETESIRYHGNNILY